MKCQIRNEFSIGMMAALLLSFASVASAQTTDVTPPPPVTPAGTTTTINDGAGDQTDPHISGNLVSYTSNADGTNRIRYYKFSDGSDTVVPNSGEDDFLSDVSGARIAFTRLDATSAIYVYDTASSGAPFALAPSADANRRNPAIGNLTVAWQDFGFSASMLEPEIVTHNIGTNVTTRLTTDALLDRSPAASADGSVIVWAKCQTTGTGCDIWQATQVAGVWTTMALTGAEGEEASPDATGQVVVYSSTRSGETDIFWKPVGGGVEQRLAITGVQANPSISGTLISFDHRDPTTGNSDVYAFDISTSTLYRITATSANETLNDVFVSPTGLARLVYASDATGDSNVYAFSFQLLTNPGEKLTDLIGQIDTLVPHEGLANSLKAKLQNALTKLGSGDLAVACNMLNAFINEVQAQSGTQPGKKLTPTAGSDLINAANEIRAALGCP